MPKVRMLDVKNRRIIDPALELAKKDAVILELQEAAEFEARVAVKLANIHFGTEDCEYCSNHIRVYEYCGECHTADDSTHCLACRLKTARLQAEEEMDADIQAKDKAIQDFR